jgi:hypothetical protein
MVEEIVELKEMFLQEALQPTIEVSITGFSSYFGFVRSTVVHA